MIFKCIKNFVGYSQVLTVLFYYFSSVQCLENNGEDQGSSLRNTLINPCATKVCSINEYCNEDLICQCRPGFKNYAGHCLQCSGEYETCTVKLDCCPMLICFGGVCRKGFEPIDFFTIFKICLGITIVSVIIVIFALLLRGLLSVKCARWFRRNETAATANSQPPYMPQFRNPRSPPQETIEEKPPSYEDCIKSSRGILELPPPYIISTNISSGVMGNDNAGQPLNSTNAATINPTDTSIIVQPLNCTSDICFNPALQSTENCLQCQKNFSLPK